MTSTLTAHQHRRLRKPESTQSTDQAKADIDKYLELLQREADLDHVHHNAPARQIYGFRLDLQLVPLDDERRHMIASRGFQLLGYCDSIRQGNDEKGVFTFKMSAKNTELYAVNTETMIELMKARASKRDLFRSARLAVRETLRIKAHKIKRRYVIALELPELNHWAFLVVEDAESKRLMDAEVL